jgi:hypothetical protein
MQKAMLLWMMDPAERDAVLLYECTKPGGTKGDHALLGILCTRNSAQLYLIKQAYYTMFNETLENHIDGCDTSIAADFQNKVCCGSHWLLEIPSPGTVYHHFWRALIHPNQDVKSGSNSSFYFYRNSRMICVLFQKKLLCIASLSHLFWSPFVCGEIGLWEIRTSGCFGVELRPRKRM